MRVHMWVIFAHCQADRGLSGVRGSLVFRGEYDSGEKTGCANN